MASGLENIETIESPFRRFVTTIGVFPTAFTDAMTYYECLAYLVKYLEDSVVPAVNNNAEALKELQDYVVHYFDNLDVQDEINNKLDQMAEDGTLQEIIGEYLNATAVWGFDSVADMKASTNLIAGSYAQTLGFHTLNDGGGAIYKIREPDNDDVVDERLLIAIGDELVAELVIENNTLNVLQIGIKKDGSSNSDLGILSSYVNTYDVYIPDGNYILEDNIEITRDNTVFKCEGTITIDNLHSIILKANNCNIDIHNITNGNFNGNGFIITNKNDISTVYNNIKIDQIFKTDNGILVEGTGSKGIQYNKITFNLIRANIGIKFKLVSTSSWSNENTFNGGRIMGGTGVKFEKITSQTNPFDGNKFYNIGFEEIEKIAELEKAEHQLFTGLRTQESITGVTWFSFDTDSKSNEIHSQFHIYIDKITDNNTTNNLPNVFYAHPIAMPNGNAISDKVKFVYNKPFSYTRPFYRVPVTQRYTEGDVNVTEDVYYNGMMLSCGCDSNKTLNLILPAIFTDNGVHEFYFRISFIGSGSTINVKDSGGNTIFTRTTTDSSESAKYFKISKNFYTNTNLTPLWLAEELQ